MNLPWNHLNSTANWDSTQFRSPLQQLVDDFFTEYSVQKFQPRINISETETEYKVSAELPGLEEKDFEVLLEDNVLRIRGERKTSEDHKDKTFTRHEFSYGSFERAFELPVEVDAEKVDAKFKNGVLNLTLQKVKAAQRSKKIEIQSH